MPRGTQWSFEADYLTVCNCDWGCPCNFNARPTQGNCDGLGAWRVKKGVFGTTKLDDVTFAAAIFFPGPIEQGSGTSRLYVDTRTTPAQRQAIEAIFSGKHGGGIFEIFAGLCSKVYPTKVARIEFEVKDGKARFGVRNMFEAESELLTYPDGSTIRPIFTLPHGIEYKTALATNATHWWIRDEVLLARHQNKYAAVATVKFSNKGCVG
jgi:hypothetical protein